MKHTDISPVNEAWSKVEHFERDIQREQLLALAPKPLSWRYRLVELLLRAAQQLEPKLKPRSAKDAQPCGAALCRK